MSYTIPASAVIDHTPEAIETFHVYGFDWIDNLHFIFTPRHFIADPSGYLAVARERFVAAPSRVDGEIGLLWPPPFVFPFGQTIPDVGVVVWHVKQGEDGISWLLSPRELPFECFGWKQG